MITNKDVPRSTQSKWKEIVQILGGEDIKSYSFYLPSLCTLLCFTTSLVLLYHLHLSAPRCVPLPYDVVVYIGHQKLRQYAQILLYSVINKNWNNRSIFRNCEYIPSVYIQCACLLCVSFCFVLRVGVLFCSCGVKRDRHKAVVIF